MDTNLASLSKKKLLKEFRQLHNWATAQEASKERAILEYLKESDRAERLERENAQLKSELRAALSTILVLMGEE